MKRFINELPPGFNNWFEAFRFVEHHVKKNPEASKPGFKFMLLNPNRPSSIRDANGQLPKYADDDMYEISYDYMRMMLYREVIINLLFDLKITGNVDPHIQNPYVIIMDRTGNPIE